MDSSPRLTDSLVKPRLGSNLDSRRALGLTVCLASVALVLSVTLFPYDFSGHKASSVSRGWKLGWEISGPSDILLNVLLFLPFGFGISSAFRLKKLQLPVVVLALSFGLSYLVEVAQKRIPLRSPSLVDVGANCLGGAAGSLASAIWKLRKPSFGTLSWASVGFMAGAALISISLERQSLLVNWDSDFPLLIGNELTGDRPWKGKVYELYISDRAFSESKVKLSFQASLPDRLADDSLMAYYRFDVWHGSGYPDLLGHLPDLVWTSNDTPRDLTGEVRIGHSNWLQSKVSASYLTRRIMRSSQFTIGVTAEADGIEQHGPARIVSLSKNFSARNFTVGQEGRDLVFRLRTPVTGTNGTLPELVAPGVFSAGTRIHLVATYDGSLLRLYVDGRPLEQDLKLGPGVAAFQRFYEPPNRTGILSSNTLYYLCVFLPLGCFLLLIVESQTACPGRGVATCWAVWVAVAPFLIEIVLIGVSGKAFDSGNVLLSAAFLGAPTLFFLLLKLSRD